jgi:hypothetical protein
MNHSRAQRGWRAGAALALLLMLAMRPAAAASEPQRQWYSVHLDGRKIGQMLSERTESATGVDTRQRLQLALDRDGQALNIVSDQLMRETVLGEPLGFRSVIDLGGSRTEIEGTVADGVANVHILQGEGQQQRFEWPEGALLAEGQRLAAVKAGTRTGTRYQLIHFDLDALQAIPISSEVLGVQTVDLFGRSEQLLALRQVMNVAGSSVESELWVDRGDFALRRMRLPMLGVHLEALACDQACANAANQPTDILAATSVRAPRELTPRERQRTLRYAMEFDGKAPSLISLPGQERRAEASGLRLTVDPAGSVDRAPEPADTQPNRWLESDHPELIAMAQRMGAGAQTDAETMQQLQAGVATHIGRKTLRIGYATALQTARLAEGDCTEHALLLAALGRASGIPTRVASGLAYASALGARQPVFVPHAWVYAWIDDRWQGFDAALPRFGSGHLALVVGDGDPFGFYAGLDLLGRVRIAAIDRVRH